MDFDNTIARYDVPFLAASVAYGLAAVSEKIDKATIRARARHRRDGESLWQKMQAEVYGLRHGPPVLAVGFTEFVLGCRSRAIPLFIVSHKTVYPAQDSSVDLQALALAWMSDNRFFESEGLAFRQADVFFEATRALKIRRLVVLRCSHHVDDLMEVFSDSQFPSTVRGILIGSNPAEPRVGSLRVVSAWNDIRQELLR